VPGTAPPQESRPVGYGVIRAGVGADSGKGHSIEQQLEHHWTRTFQEEYLASVKKHGLHFDQKYLRDSLRPIIPYPTRRFFRAIRRAVACSWQGTLSPGTSAWSLDILQKATSGNFAPRRGWRAQPRVSTLGTDQPERRALKLKGRQIERPFKVEIGVQWRNCKRSSQTGK
jgi:hypothetical protein